MKAKCLIEFEFRIVDGKIQGLFSPWMGHSTCLLLSGEEQEEDRKEGILWHRLPKEEDSLVFSIPSGSFKSDPDCSLIIKHRTDYAMTLQARGTWEGKWASLMGGLSCYREFKVVYFYSLIESSWGSMHVEVYKALRAIRNHEGEQSFKLCLHAIKKA